MSSAAAMFVEPPAADSATGSFGYNPEGRETCDALKLVGSTCNGRSASFETKSCSKSAKCRLEAAVCYI